jgi:surface antigen
MTIKSSLTAAIAVFSVVLFFAPSANAQEKPDTKKDEKPPVTVIVQLGDTLTSIAESHGTTYTRLYDANAQIADPNQIDIGDEIRIPDTTESLPDRLSAYAAQAAAYKPAASTTSRTYTSKPINSSSYYVGNGMWCTDYVHSKRPDVAVYGNAGYNWLSSAKAAGKSTGTTPQAGAVAVTNGHVAYVESVNSDGSYVVSEMGWNYKAGNYNKRTVSPGAFGGFIY